MRIVPPLIVALALGCATSPERAALRAERFGLRDTASIRLVARQNAVDFTIYALVDRDDGFERGVAYVGYHPQVRGAVIGNESCAPFELEWRQVDGRVEVLLYQLDERGEQRTAAHLIPDANLSDAERARFFEVIAVGTGGKCRAMTPPAAPRA